MTMQGLSALDRGILSELSVEAIVDALTILSLKNKSPATGVNPSTFARPPAAKLPQLTLEMTKPQFRKFIIDWNVFTSITN